MCHLCPHAKLHPLTQPLLAIMVLFGSIAVSTSLSSLHNNQSEPLKMPATPLLKILQWPLLSLRGKPSAYRGLYSVCAGKCARTKNQKYKYIFAPKFIVILLI